VAERKPFECVKAGPDNPKYEQMISREVPLYKKDADIRNEFERDYTRVLHSLGYRRLKHKTQVFFNTRNDHICTRIEHVNHVESVSYTIATYLGLSTALTKAIAIAHDLGHSPFGHQGERTLKRISQKYLGETFWHEKNGLNFVDNIELLEDDKRRMRNLSLTYAVRDGIISHCGELDTAVIKPRDEFIDLNDIKVPGQYSPFTWEGCVVKLADRIAYVGRDIEDAVRVGFIGKDELRQLDDMAQRYHVAANTTGILHNMITKLSENSSPERGIGLPEEYIEMLNAINQFNVEHIYRHKRFNFYIKYVDLVLESAFEALMDAYSGEDTLEKMLLIGNDGKAPEYLRQFGQWLSQFCMVEGDKNPNKKIYGRLDSERTYMRAVIDYISGMTDQYVIRIFEELTMF